ncbi:hypothetical protein BI343_17600 [Chromobacterium amazonense]|jgi:hypothetical protein|uniref:hypothetical protein n=1 Tax=Chromobacterium amazonense TaxID=1382803 RepID=UPI0008DA9DAA|nr:hypothetical protein [Chromobacterium amazonense]OHX15779.1 hypothetical protein BI343_17600 [Chromobacterium amazonense]
MKHKHLLTALALSIVSTSILAGPAVTITFKNQSQRDVSYQPIGKNENETYANAAPKPGKLVKANSSDTYLVSSPLSPDVNYAFVRYTDGIRQCEFRTTFVNAPKPGGLLNNGVIPKVPQWNKTATGSGGAFCNAEITYYNPATLEWSVEFTMR